MKRQQNMASSVPTTVDVERGSPLIGTELTRDQKLLLCARPVHDRPLFRLAHRPTLCLFLDCLCLT